MGLKFCNFEPDRNERCCSESLWLDFLFFHLEVLYKFTHAIYGSLIIICSDSYNGSHKTYSATKYN